MIAIRNLDVLDINDRQTGEFRSGEGDATYFEVIRLPSWQMLQRALARNEEISPDLILTDVSFDRDSSVQLATINEATDPDAALQQAIVPVGPTLALCFLRTRPIVGFGFYSGHIAAPELTRYPPFLVAMGLLAAKAEGRVFASQHLSNIDGPGNLDAYIEGLATSDSRLKCLKLALEGFRRSLGAKLRAGLRRDGPEAGRFRLLNAASIHEWLDPIRRALEADENAISRIEICEDRHVRVWSAGVQDRISMRSLFADLLQWSNSYIEKAAIPSFLAWFDGICDADPCWTYAVDAMDKQRRRDIEIPGRLDIVVQQLYRELPKNTLHEIFRLCVLFANIEAWAAEHGESVKHPVRKNVYTPLGLKPSQQHTYEEWFGERPEQKSGASTSRRRISGATQIYRLGVPTLPVFNPDLEEGDIGRCFIQRGTLLSEEDDRRIEEYRRHFKLPPWHHDFGKPYAVASKAAFGA